MRKALLVGCVLAFLVVPPVQPASGAGGDPFAYRGVIEGYYGPPWSHTERLAAFPWMQEHDLNLYVYAPKDDPYQRANWRDPYPVEAAAEMATEIEAARAVAVSFVPNVSPGLPLLASPPAPGTARSRPLCFSCPGDVAVLVAKLRSFVDAGSTAVMLSFDDTLPVSPHWPDVAAYGTGSAATGRMHRDLLNRLTRELGPTVTVFTVLAEYAGTRDSPYLQAVRSGGGLAAGIEVMWTGTAVISPTIQATDASTYAHRVGRDRVVVWDNYPAHDMTGSVFGRPPARLFLGPYQGRAADLASGASGLVANIMQLPRASRVPLATVADYLSDPLAYDPEASWQRALAETGGDGIAALAESSRSSRLDRRESETFTTATAGLLAALDTGYWPEANQVLASELDRETTAARTLALDHPELEAEVRPWLESLAASARAASLVAQAVALQQPSLTVVAVEGPEGVEVSGVARPPRISAATAAAATAQTACSRVRSYAAVTHGDRFTFLIDALYVGENRVDRFCASLTRRLLQRLPALALAGTSGVALEVDGRPVRIDGSGRFAVELTSVPTDGIAVSATDRSGGSTRVVVAAD